MSLCKAILTHAGLRFNSKCRKTRPAVGIFPAATGGFDRKAVEKYGILPVPVT